MCVLHNSVQHEEYPNRTNKALGFVDSLDLVKRWRHDLADAEKMVCLLLEIPILLTQMKM